jgi:predicted metal-dependent peptidase
MTPYSPESLRECAARMAAARFILFRDAPFFGPLVARLRPVPAQVESGTMGVMADGRMLFDPDFVLGLNLKQLAGSMAHETLHLVGDVFGRRGDRDPYLWNIAHDAVINPMVLSYPLELPEGVVRFEGAEKLSAEQVYERLLREEESRGRKKKVGKGRGGPNPLGSPGCGCADHSHPDNARATAGALPPGALTPQDWLRAVAEAAEGARMQGNLPAGIARWVDELLRPRLNWTQYIARKASGALGKVRYTYQRPSRRSYATGFVLPGRVQEGRDATIALDTSGSIGTGELSRFAAECEGIFKSVGAKLTIFACDAAIASEATVTSIRHFEPKGGGGTSFVPVFDRIRERRMKVRLLVYFTDLQGTFPTQKPPYPVIWCVPEDVLGNAPRPPFGKVLPVPVGIRA